MNYSIIIIPGKSKSQLRNMDSVIKAISNVGFSPLFVGESKWDFFE